MEFEELLKVAEKAANPWQISKHTCVGKVGAAILTDKGNIYQGVSMHKKLSGSLGYIQIILKKLINGVQCLFIQVTGHLITENLFNKNSAQVHR